MSNDITVGFGLADIKVGGEDIGLQADGATFSAEANLLDIEVYELGLYDLYLDSWNISLKVVFQEEGFDKLKMALPALDELTADGKVVGLTDGRIHQRMRSKAKEITVHARDAEDDSRDITIYMAYPRSVFERTYGKEVVSYEVEFVAFPRTGDGSKGGNYFRIGSAEGTPVIPED